MAINITVRKNIDPIPVKDGDKAYRVCMFIYQHNVPHMPCFRFF